MGPRRPSHPQQMSSDLSKSPFRGDEWGWSSHCLHGATIGHHALPGCAQNIPSALEEVQGVNPLG